MNHLTHDERQDLGEQMAERYERGRRASGEDVPPFGCPDALIRAWTRLTLLNMPPEVDAISATESARRSAESRLLDMVRRVCRQRHMGTDLYREIHDATAIAKAEIRKIESRRAS